MAHNFTNLEQLLDHIGKASNGDRVTLGTIVEAVGKRSFGPLLLMVGVLIASPLSGVPGMTSTMSVFVLLVAGQMLFGRKHFWLPNWLLKRSVSQENLLKAINWLKPPARFIDPWLRPRLTVLVNSTGANVIAIACILIAVGMPAMELVPFSDSGAGLALTFFGLSLVHHDGVLALLAFTFSALVYGFIIAKLL